MPEGSPRRDIGAVAWLVTVAVAGIAYRLVYVFDQIGWLDADNAVVALMARHILEGKHYVFFWGQRYMGTLEPYSIAAAAAVFGLNDVVLRAVPLVYGSVYMASFYGLGRRLWDEETGRAALVLAALCPPLLAVWSSGLRGGYPEVLCLGQATLLVALALARRERWGIVATAALGLLAGLAFWTHFLAAVFLVVAAAVLAWGDPALWRRGRAWGALLAFFAGSLPLWIGNLRDGFSSFDLARTAEQGAAPGEALRALVVTHGPKLLGVREVAGGGEFVLGPLGWVVGALLAVALAGSIARTLAARDGGIVCVLLLAVLLALFLPTRYGAWNTQRYLLPAYGAILPLLARAWVVWRRRSPAIAFGVAVATLAVWAAGAWQLHRDLSGPRPLDPHLPRAIEILEASGIRHGYADHAEALVNTYRSNERVVFLDPSIGRYPVDELGEWRPRAILTATGHDRLTGALEGLACRFRVERLGSRTLAYDIEPTQIGGVYAPRQRWRATASRAAEEAGRAIDEDPATRWATHAPQRPGATFEVDFGEDLVVSGARLEAAAFPRDVPRGLRLEGLLPEGGRALLAGPLEPIAGLRVAGGRVHLDAEPVVELRFAPVRLRGLRFVQTGSDPIFDWSITEVHAIVPESQHSTGFRSP